MLKDMVMPELPASDLGPVFFSWRGKGCDQSAAIVGRSSTFVGKGLSEKTARSGKNKA